MGQYQQWLHYREVERQLQTQIEALETELADLEARARSIEEVPSSEESEAGKNELLRLLFLATRLDAHTVAQEHQPATSGSLTSLSENRNEAAEADSAEDSQQFSPTFFGWGLPPDFSPRERALTVPRPAFEGPSPSLPPSPLPQPGIELLPEDIASFFDEYSQTDPRLELPWWQQPSAPAPPPMHGSSPIDQQGMRNKQEIERWLERWRRQIAQPDQSVRPAHPQQPYRPTSSQQEKENFYE